MFYAIVTMYDNTFYLYKEFIDRYILRYLYIYIAEDKDKICLLLLEGLFIGVGENLFFFYWIVLVKNQMKWDNTRKKDKVFWNINEWCTGVLGEIIKHIYFWAIDRYIINNSINLGFILNRKVFSSFRLKKKVFHVFP